MRSGVTQLADLLPRYVNRSNPVRPVTRNNSVTGPGVGALLAQLIWAVCGPGDGVLIPTVGLNLSLVVLDVLVQEYADRLALLS